VAHYAQTAIKTNEPPRPLTGMGLFTPLQTVKSEGVSELKCLQLTQKTILLKIM
jgi:hypothetical protein